MDFKLIVQTEVVSFNCRTSFSLNTWFFALPRSAIVSHVFRPEFSAGCMYLVYVMLDHLNLCACFDWPTFFPR